MRRALAMLWCAVAIFLAACTAPSITINVNQSGTATATATPRTAATLTVAIAQHAVLPPESVVLPSGPTVTAPPFQPGQLIQPTLPVPTPIVQTPALYRPAAIGQAVGAWGWSFRCTGAESPPEGLAWSPAGNRLQPVGKWVVAALDLTNSQPAPQSIRADEFVVRDSQLRAFGPTAALGAADYSAFRGGQRFEEPVAPGATARYFLAFDIPADAVGLRLVLTSRPVANGFEVSFDLGR